MTIRLIESWKTYPVLNDHTRRWTFQYGVGGIIVPGGMRTEGTSVVYCNTHWLNLPTIMMGFWFTPLKRAPSVNNSSLLHINRNGEYNTDQQVGLGNNPDGTISVFRGDNFSGYGGTTIANGTTPLAIGQRYWIEFKLVTGVGTAGSYELRINGFPEILLTGIDTAPRGVGSTGLTLSAGAGAIHLYGGLYVGDGAEGFLGPCEVERIYPAGFTTEPKPNYTLLGGVFDQTKMADRGGADAVYSNPSYNPQKVHAVQSMRWVTAATPGNAYVSLDQPNAPIPNGGIVAPDDALYVEVLMSKAFIPPPFSSRRRPIAACG